MRSAIAHWVNRAGSTLCCELFTAELLDVCLDYSTSSGTVAADEKKPCRLIRLIEVVKQGEIYSPESSNSKSDRFYAYFVGKLANR